MRIGRHDDRRRVIDMAAQSEELLHLVEFGCLDRGDRIFLAVELAGLQRLEQLREGQHGGLGAQRLEPQHHHLGLRQAHPQAFEIVRRGDRMLRVGHVAHAVFAPGERHLVLVGETLEEVLPDRAIEHRMGVRGAAEQERDVEHVGIREGGGQPGTGDESQIDAAKLHGFDDLHLAAKRRVGELLDADAATGGLGDRVGHGGGTGAELGILREQVSHPEGARSIRGSGEVRRGQAGGGGSAGEKQVSAGEHAMGSLLRGRASCAGSPDYLVNRRRALARRGGDCGSCSSLFWHAARAFSP